MKTRAAILTEAFLVPAVLAGGAQHELRWKLVNRCAGALAGLAIEAAFRDADPDFLAAIEGEIAAALREFCGQPEHDHAVGMILGPEGLPKRLRECMEALAKAGAA